MLGLRRRIQTAKVRTIPENDQEEEEEDMPQYAVVDKNNDVLVDNELYGET